MKRETNDYALTFDDILLVPRKSNVLPREINLTSKITSRLDLNIPILSAAMDTVTEYKMAIALAQLGGIGIIHRNMSLEDEIKEVQRVKRAEAGLILDPVTVNPNLPISTIRELIEKQDISGFPVIEGDIIIGILTKRDLWFENDWSKAVRDVMTPYERLITAPVNTTLEEAQEIMRSKKVEKLPIVDKERHLKGLYTIKDLEKQSLFPDAMKDSLGRLVVGAAVKAGEDGIKAAEKLYNVGADVIVVGFSPRPSY